MMSFSSCKTIKVVEKTVYYVPEIDFPVFPKLGECEVNNGKATTDENFFRELLIFKTLYKDAVEKYNEKKELVSKKGDK